MAEVSTYRPHALTVTFTEEEWRCLAEYAALTSHSPESLVQWLALTACNPGSQYKPRRVPGLKEVRVTPTLVPTATELGAARAVRNKFLSRTP